MWFRFHVPILALFYIASQVSLDEFAIIMSVFSLVILLFEIPSGVFADLVGKKKTLLLARFCYVLEIAGLAFFDGFYPFLIAKIISGLGVSLDSGTSSALRFETLKKMKREKDHKKISGNIFAITNISMAFVFIIGAYLFTLHYKYPVYLSLPFIVLGFFLTFFLTEPYPVKHRLTFKKATAHFVEGIAYFFRNTSLRILALYSVPLATVIAITLSLSSVYFEMIAIPLVFMGVIAFLGSICTAYTAKKADVLEKFFGEKKSMFVSSFAILLCMFGIIFLFPYYGLLFYFLLSLVSGFFSIIIDNYTNTRVTKKHRATMLSVRNMMDNVGVAGIFFITGAVIKAVSFSAAYMLLTGFIAVSFIALHIVLAKRTRMFT